MRKRIALKRLSASDLTFFEFHFRNTTGTKQKAFNLDRVVFIDKLYPNLPAQIDVLHDRLPIDLSIYGPGLRGLHNLQRKILKQQKNWRMDGELIYGPPDDENRYSLLAKGDFVILEFTGDHEPKAVYAYLAAQADEADTDLHNALTERYSGTLSEHKGMEELDPEELADLVNSIDLPANHPILGLTDAAVLEDAASSGLEGIRTLRHRRGTRGVGRDELERARRNAARIGRLGEELLNDWLEDQRTNGPIESYRWDSDENAISPYDFSLIEDGERTRLIDAKSTTGKFNNAIHVSIAELYEMAESECPYDIYRLYAVRESSAQMRIASDMKQFALSVLESLNTVPDGVRVDGVSIDPRTLDFGDVIKIEIDEA